MFFRQRKGGEIVIRMVLMALTLMIGVPGFAAAEIKLEAPVAPMPENAPGLRVGDKAPDFEAGTHTGGRVHLSQLYATGPVVLVFYRGAWCPYCNLHLRHFEQVLETIRGYGADVLAVSVDKPQYAQKAAAEGNLEFEVVSNPDASILEAYGLVFQVPADLAVMYRDKYGIDLEAHSGRKDHVIAVPATYVIDSSGMIRFAYADPDYKRRATPQQVLEVLEEIK